MRLCCAPLLALIVAVLAVVGCAEDPAGRSDDPQPPSPPPPPPPPAPAGSLRVELIGWGNGVDIDGFTLTVGSQSFNVLWNGSATLPSSAGQTLTATLAGVAGHCAPDATSRIVTTTGGADTLRFAIGCFGELAYTEQLPGGDWRIRYLNAIGQIIPLAEAPGRQFIHEWSPDGTRLLYTTNERSDRVVGNLSGFDVAQVNVATGARVWLATSAAADLVPRWSPDGTQVAYNRWYLQGPLVDSALAFVVGADGSGTRQILFSPAWDFDPDWVQGGSAFVFGCRRYHYLGSLCRMSASGSDLTALVPEHRSAQHVEASPQGDWVSYLAGEDTLSVWTVPAAGGVPTRLAPERWTFAARWNPAGTRLAVNVVETTDPYTYGVRVVERSGTNASANLTAFSGNVGPASWSSDGQWLAVSAIVPGGQWNYVMRADGSGRRQVTFGANETFNPLWRPTSVFVPPPSWLTFAPAAPPAPGAALRAGRPEAQEGACIGAVGTRVGRVPCGEPGRSH